MTPNKSETPEDGHENPSLHDEFWAAASGGAWCVAPYP